LQLLPFAVLGALAGGLLLLGVAVAFRHREGHVAHCILPAHAGCALAMVPGLLLCAAGIAWPLALGAEFALAAAAAVCIDRAVTGTLRTRAAPGAGSLSGVAMNSTNSPAPLARRPVTAAEISERASRRARRVSVVLPTTPGRRA
jgi:hypothetical protein